MKSLFFSFLLVSSIAYSQECTFQLTDLGTVERMTATDLLNSQTYDKIEEVEGDSFVALLELWKCRNGDVYRVVMWAITANGVNDYVLLCPSILHWGSWKNSSSKASFFHQIKYDEGWLNPEFTEPTLRCHHIRSTGALCSRNAQAGTDFCYQHGN